MMETPKQFARNMNKHYPHGIRKYCSKCGYYVRLCPDVDHCCPFCGTKLEELKEKREEPGK